MCSSLVPFQVAQKDGKVAETVLYIVVHSCITPWEKKIFIKPYLNKIFKVPFFWCVKIKFSTIGMLFSATENSMDIKLDFHRIDR